MNLQKEGFEEEIYRFIDRIKDLLSPKVWENILLDCSKNEILVLWLLYRRKTVNMSQIAEYINTPLNTATGIVARMEKKELIIRERSEEDKRIVILKLGQKGETQMQAMVREFMYYGSRVLESFTQEEIELFWRMMNKVMEVMQKERETENGRPEKKIRKIIIE